MNDDYGDQAFPGEQLLPPEHYRDDLETCPRPHLPAWLSGYIRGCGPGH